MLTTLADWLALMADGLRVLRTGTWRQRFLRVRFLLLFAVLWPPVAVLTWLLLALDHVLFPGFKQVEIKAPLFIVGNLRTGSTYLHKTLGKDSEGIATFHTLDLFLPSITARKLVGLLGRVDAALGGYGRRLVVAVDDHLLPAFRRIHDVRLFDPEEDDFALLVSLKSACMFEVAPAVPRFRRLFFMDEEMDRAEQDRTWALYRALVQRHLYVAGPHKQFVSKNPLQTHKLQGLLRTFPDARVINLVRSPLKTVPSVSSMWHFVWHESGARPHGELDPDGVIALVRSFYTAPGPVLEALGERGQVVRYEDLLEAPEPVVTEAFEALDLAVGPGLRAVLAEAQARAGSYESKHKYKGASHGLSEEVIVDAFADIMAAHGYPRPADADADAAK